MSGQFIKNIDHKTILEMEGLVQYQEGTVVSRTLAQSKAYSVTLFAFDKGEEISAHSAPGDALVYILDGLAEITIGDEKFDVKKGQTIVMPANIPHALLAKERFKMMLIVIFQWVTVTWLLDFLICLTIWTRDLSLMKVFHLICS